MVSTIYSCAYFPNIAYLSSMLYQDQVYIEKEENFIRQSYRSRCYINGANGILPLIVPVQKGRKKVLIQDIRIANDEPWMDQHERSIISSYGNAPFFDHYFEEVSQIINKKHVFLYDLCLESLTLCLKMLKMEIELLETQDFVKKIESPHKDFRNIFLAKDLETHPDFYHPDPYFQLFGKQFARNLSVIDLIFCEGPMSLNILKASFKSGFEQLD